MSQHYFSIISAIVKNGYTQYQGRKAKISLYNEMGVDYLWKNDLVTPSGIHVNLGKAGFQMCPKEKIMNELKRGHRNAHCNTVCK